MTFQERINDNTKVPLFKGFVQDIRETANVNNLHEDAIYNSWKEYTKQCGYMDQSPVYYEFKEWNKLT